MCDFYILIHVLVLCRYHLTIFFVELAISLLKNVPQNFATLLTIDKKIMPKYIFFNKLGFSLVKKESWKGGHYLPQQNFETHSVLL